MNIISGKDGCDYPVEPCPFCGKNQQAFFHDSEGEVFIECVKCSTFGPVASTEAVAVERWNHRENVAAPPAPAAEKEGRP